ncbi:MAG: 6-hydroxymethylpterin diphosphokinase MptE-like protein [Phycisphaerales bacterium]
MSSSDFHVPDPARLEKNLAALGPNASGMAERIRAAGPVAPGDLELESGRRSGVTGRWRGTPLASAIDPVAEANRLADQVDLLETAAVFVHGFGLGTHVTELARRMKRTGAIVVLEPDLELLHAVFSTIDLSEGLAASNVILVTDPDDRAGFGAHQQAIGWLLGQGTAFLDHPPSRVRLGDAALRFSRVMTDVATHARLSITTAMLRGVTTMENQIANLPRYATGPGVAGWKDAQAGRPAIIVSAGPSLPATLDRLADPAVREHAVIIAVQTVLKPLLERGIRPHFVTALDYHPISTQYYEGLSATDVDGITLVIDPKAHPAIADAYPGAVHCCGSKVLDRILRDAARPMGELPAGATVAHLCAYLARHLGCDPLILAGQDLGFTDRMYYGPGAAVHQTWAPELGPFNSVASMEWQRIARHRGHVEPVDAVGGGTVLSDGQMISYRQQFERDFAADQAAQRRVINTARGADIRSTEAMDFDAALEAFLDRPLSPWPHADPGGGAARTPRAVVASAMGKTTRDVAALADAAGRSHELLQEMIERQSDASWMPGAFKRLYAERERVSERLDALSLVDQLNQIGVFQRLRADRRITLTGDDDPVATQRAELERDVVNVEWIGDAAKELIDMLEHARRVLRRQDGERPDRPGSASVHGQTAGSTAAGPGGRPKRDQRVAAIVPIDADDADHAFGPASAPPVPASDAPCRVLATLSRLQRSRELDEVIVLLESGVRLPASVQEWIEGRRPDGGPDVVLVQMDAAPYGSQRRGAVRSARAFAPGAWRGGISGIGGVDTALAADTMVHVAKARSIDAVVPVGPDWRWIDPDLGVDRLVARFREDPDAHEHVFTPLAPGLGSAVLRRSLLEELASLGRLGTLGSRLVHQPMRSFSDPLGGRSCIPIVAALRRHVSAIDADHPATLAPDVDLATLPADAGAADVTAALRSAARGMAPRPRHIEIPTVDGLIAADVVAQLAAFGPLDGIALTLHGPLDPLHWDGWMDVAGAARELGAASVHVRTTFRARSGQFAGTQDIVAALAGGIVDVLSVDLHAVDAEGYRAVHGCDAYDDVTRRIQALIDARPVERGPSGLLALTRPWIVPRLGRHPLTIEAIPAFHEHWQHCLGVAHIEAQLPSWITPPTSDARPILALPEPPEVVDRLAGDTLVVAPGDPADLATQWMTARTRSQTISALTTSPIPSPARTPTASPTPTTTLDSPASGGLTSPPIPHPIGLRP